MQEQGWWSSYFTITCKLSTRVNSLSSKHRSLTVHARLQLPEEKSMLSHWESIVKVCLTCCRSRVAVWGRESSWGVREWTWSETDYFAYPLRHLKVCIKRIKDTVSWLVSIHQKKFITRTVHCISAIFSYLIAYSKSYEDPLISSFNASIWS